jgi:pimeloyl-ACP methyl ester carboxylesterase
MGSSHLLFSGTHSDWSRIDLLSLIDGSALDFQLLISYLPAYLPQFTRLRTVMAGVSLGGHTAWRMAALVPDIEAFSMTVGCPNLTALMLSRLGIDSKKLGTTANELYKVPYDDLAQVLDDTQKRRWPRRLHEIASGQDRKIAEEFPDVPLLLMGGKQDPLVPVKFTAPWVEKRSGNSNVEFFVQANTGHSCTKEMVFKLAVWLGDIFAVET